MKIPGRENARGYANARQKYAAVFSHPDCNRRYRNHTGSTPPKTRQALADFNCR